MKVLAFVSPQCGRGLEIAATLGEPVALAVAPDDSVFASAVEVRFAAPIPVVCASEVTAPPVALDVAVAVPPLADRIALELASAAPTVSPLPPVAVALAYT